MLGRQAPWSPPRPPGPGDPPTAGSTQTTQATAKESTMRQTAAAIFAHRAIPALAAALLACGAIGAGAAETPYYNPANTASKDGFTTDYTLYKTIGCPGKGLMDAPCQDAAPARAAAPGRRPRSATSSGTRATQAMPERFHGGNARACNPAEARTRATRPPTPASEGRVTRARGWGSPPRPPAARGRGSCNSPLRDGRSEDVGLGTWDMGLPGARAQPPQAATARRPAGARSRSCPRRACCRPGSSRRDP